MEDRSGKGNSMTAGSWEEIKARLRQRVHSLCDANVTEDFNMIKPQRE
jgi:hypothetical protein